MDADHRLIATKWQRHGIGNGNVGKRFSKYDQSWKQMREERYPCNRVFLVDRMVHSVKTNDPKKPLETQTNVSLWFIFVIEIVPIQSFFQLFNYWESFAVLIAFFCETFFCGAFLKRCTRSMTSGSNQWLCCTVVADCKKSSRWLWTKLFAQWTNWWCWLWCASQLTSQPNHRTVSAWNAMDDALPVSSLWEFQNLITINAIHSFRRSSFPAWKSNQRNPSQWPMSPTNERRVKIQLESNNVGSFSAKVKLENCMFVIKPQPDELRPNG